MSQDGKITGFNSFLHYTECTIFNTFFFGGGGVGSVHFD